MSRGGHNWRGTGTVEGSRSLDVMRLARAGYLSDRRFGSWRWTYEDGTTASIDLQAGRREIILNYRVRSDGEEWQSVRQPVPIRWTPCRFGGERPWFVCNVWAGGVHCGRRAIRDQALGMAYAADDLDVPARYEVHLDRKLERMLTMLIRLRELRRATVPGSFRLAKPSQITQRDQSYPQHRPITDADSVDRRAIMALSRIWCRGLVSHGAPSRRAQSRSSLVRPYMWRLTNFSLVFCPSACPFDHGSIKRGLHCGA